MKKLKRILCLLLVLAACLSVFLVTASAAGLTITSPTNGGTVSKSNPGMVKWNDVAGAKEYCITIKNEDTGKVLVGPNAGLRLSTSYSLSNATYDLSKTTKLKIWVGAMSKTGYDATSNTIKDTDTLAHATTYVTVNVSSHSDLEDDGPADMEEVPSKPTNVTAETLSTSQIEVSWKAVSGATKYKVYRSESSSSSSAKLIWTGTKTSYIDSGLSEGTRYYYWVKASNSAGDSSFSSRDYAWTGEVAELTSPGISPTHASTSTINGVVSKVYYGKLSSAVACNDDGSFTIKWDNTDGEFRFAVKRLNGEPDISSLKSGKDVSESGTDIQSYQTGRTTASYTISAENVSAAAGKWIKVYIGGLGWNCHYYFKVTPKAGSSLDLDSNAITLTWNASSAAVDTGTSSFDAVITYNNVTNAQISAGYDYEWLTWKKTGNSIVVQPTRNNYSASARTATVKVTSGSQSDSFTVTQKACGEAAPTLTAVRSGVTLKDGSDLGGYAIPQKGNMTVELTTSRVRRVYAALTKVGSSTELAKCDLGPETLTGATNEKITVSLPLSGLTTAGEYQITIKASNSGTRSDLYSQSPFTNSSKSMTLTFEMVGEDDETLKPDDEIDASAYLKRDTTVAIVGNEYVYKGTSHYVTQIVNPYYYLPAKRDVSKSADSSVLKKIIDQFDVLNKHSSSASKFGSGFYYPSGGSTYCTTYVRDVANAYGACFPSYVCSKCALVKYDKKYMGQRLLDSLKSDGLTCTCGGSSSSLMAFHVGSSNSQNAINDPFCFMMTHGAKYGWTRIANSKVASAMNYANAGYLVIGLYSDYEKGAGHAFVVYPSSDGVMHQAQAGATGAMTDGSASWNTNNNGYRRNPNNSWIEYFVYMGLGNASNDVTSETYKITYDYGYGISGGAIVKDGVTFDYGTKEYGKSYTLKAPLYSKPGYTFKGWAEHPNHLTVKYASGATYTANSDLYLYAVWEKSEDAVCTIIYNANGGSGAPASQAAQQGQSFRLSRTVPKRTGYKFDGWSLNKNGSGVKCDAGAYLAIPSGTKSITLYATWAKIEETSALKGDVDFDGDVDLLDYTKVRQYIRKKSTLSSAAQAAADMDGDGRISVVDLNMIRKIRK